MCTLTLYQSTIFQFTFYFIFLIRLSLQFFVFMETELLSISNLVLSRIKDLYCHSKHLHVVAKRSTQSTVCLLKNCFDFFISVLLDVGRKWRHSIKVTRMVSLHALKKKPLSFQLSHNMMVDGLSLSFFVCFVFFPLLHPFGRILNTNERHIKSCIHCIMCCIWQMSKKKQS